MPKAPEWFLRELHSFDPDLRLRWSPRSELWALERQVRRSLHPGTTKGNPYDDDYIRARDGFVLVGSIPPKGFGRFIFQKLRDSDLWSRGGWKQVADEMDAADEARDEAEDRAFSNENQALASDLYRILALRDGRTVYNVGYPT